MASLVSVLTAPASVAQDWPSWRGRGQNGVSDVTGLPSSWSPDGENLIWSDSWVGRSTPSVFDGRVCAKPLIVVVTVQTAHAISLEATLSFLGIGLPITEPSLGLLIANGFEYMLSQKYWISIYPGIALLIIIVTINLVGDQLRDVLNPRLQR